MTKAEYLAQLKRRLGALPENEARDAVEYYDGYLSDAGQDEAGAMERLGAPGEVAAKILAGFAVDDGAKPDKPKKRGFKLAWGIIIAIFAAPIGLPLAAAVAVIAVAFLIVLVALIISFGAGGVGLLIGGVVYVVAGIALFWHSVAMALMALGMGLAALGVGIAFWKLTAAMARAGSHGIARFVGKRILRRDGQ